MANQTQPTAATANPSSTAAAASPAQAAAASAPLSSAQNGAIIACPRQKKANVKFHVMSKATASQESKNLKEATVYFEGCGNSYSGTTIEDGTYIKKRLQLGNYKAKCHKPGYSNAKDIDVSLVTEGDHLISVIQLSQCQKGDSIRDLSYNLDTPVIVHGHSTTTPPVSLFQRSSQCELCKSNRSPDAIQYITQLKVCCDGAPNAYAPYGLTGNLDLLKYAGKRPDHYNDIDPNTNDIRLHTYALWKSWFGVVTEIVNTDQGPKHTPVVQGPDDPCPGFFVSPTAAHNPKTHGVIGEKNPRLYINAAVLNFISLPSNHNTNAALWDIVAVIIPGIEAGINGEPDKIVIRKIAYAVVAESGPADLIGEGSYALVKELTGRTETIKAPVILIMFPNTNARIALKPLFPNQNQPMDRQSDVNAGISDLGKKYLKDWAGADENGVTPQQLDLDIVSRRLSFCFAEFCIIRLESETELEMPQDPQNPNDPDRQRTRTRIAVTEKVTIKASEYIGAVKWKIAKGQSKLNVTTGHTVILTAHDLAEETIIEATDSRGYIAKIEFTVDCCFLITPAKLKLIYGHPMDDAYASSLANHFNTYYDKFGVDSCLRQAHFFAQVYQEARSGKPVAENGNYNAAALVQTFGSRFTSDPNKVGDKKVSNMPENNETNPSLALASDYEHNSRKLFNHIYADRMGNGNEASGDGYNYRGRGYLQITGKSIYTEVQRVIKNVMGDPPPIDIVTNYTSVETNPAGLVAAMAYWTWKQLPAKADTGDSNSVVDSITRVINPGLFANTPAAITNRTERQNNFQKTKVVFKTDNCSNK